MYSALCTSIADPKPTQHRLLSILYTQCTYMHRKVDKVWVWSLLVSWTHSHTRLSLTDAHVTVYMYWGWNTQKCHMHRHTLTTHNSHKHDSYKRIHVYMYPFDCFWWTLLFCDIKSKLWLVSYQHTKTCVSNLQLNFVQLSSLHHNSKEQRLQKNNIMISTVELAPVGTVRTCTCK